MNINTTHGHGYNLCLVYIPPGTWFNHEDVQRQSDEAPEVLQLSLFGELRTLKDVENATMLVVPLYFCVHHLLVSLY